MRYRAKPDRDLSRVDQVYGSGIASSSLSLQGEIASFPEPDLDPCAANEIPGRVPDLEDAVEATLLARP